MTPKLSAGAIAATVLLVVAAPAAAAQTINVSTNTGADAPGCGTGTNAPCQTIRYAIDNIASSGDTVSVAAGTYVVSSTVDVDKTLTIDGAGDGLGGTIVEAANQSTNLGNTPFVPDPAPGCTNLADQTTGDHSVLLIDGSGSGQSGSGSTIENMTINGDDDASPGVGNYPFVALEVYDADATLDSDQISGAQSLPLGGAQCASDLQDYDDTGAGHALTAENLNINSYQKNGAAFWGTGLRADLTDSTVTGVGPTPELAANGVLYSGGADGTVSGSTITGNECNEGNACGPDEFTQAQATGILAFESGSVTASGDTLDGNDTGFFFGYPESGTGTISNSIVNDNRFQGLLLNDGTTTASGDEISGSEYGVQVLSFGASTDPPDPENAIANLSDNTITANTNGIEADDDQPSNPGAFPVITAHNNQITQNSTAGFANDVDEPQNATGNYWGCPSGPGATGCDTITGVAASMVSFIPFIGSTIPLPPGLTAAFGETTMPLGGAAPLTFTITNPNSGSGLSQVGFSDTLPSGLSVATSNGVSGSCGSGTITALPGSSSISLANGTLAAGSSCTFSVQVSATTTGSKTDTTSAVSSDEGGSGNAASASTTVVGPPTVSVLVPGSGATYAFGQVVQANYACQEAANGPGISSCTGSAGSGAPTDTTSAGQHTFTVTATSSDGLTTTRSVTYTVLPNNRFTVKDIKTQRTGSLSFRYTVPGPGRLSVLVTARKSKAKGQNANAAATLQPAAGRIAIGRATLTVKSAGSRSFVLHLNKAGLALLASHPHGILVRLWVIYQPSGGTTRQLGFHGIQIR